jgi:hypothetical protein
MKKLFLFMVLILIVTVATAQVSTTFEQICRDNGSGVSGSTWSRGATHYTEWTDMRGVDSAWVVVDFPDSIACAIYATSNVGGGVDTTSGILNSDSTKYAANGTGMAKSYSTVGYYVPGFPLLRFKIYFGAGAQQDSQGTEKYRVFIKKYRHQ